MFRSDAREAEGAPLLREYRVKSSIEGSNPSHSATSMPPSGGVFVWREWIARALASIACVAVVVQKSGFWGLTS